MNIKQLSDKFNADSLIVNLELTGIIISYISCSIITIQKSLMDRHLKYCKVVKLLAQSEDDSFLKTEQFDCN